jgi:nascent polypeptide-associated complex subunit alpha
MLPGLGRGMNPHKMKRMMKQMGINVDELTDVEKIVIRTSDKEYIFDGEVAVTVMTTQGQKTFQIIGNPRVQDRGLEKAESDSDETIISSAEDEDETLKIPQEDIELVCAQTGVDEDEAKAALEACNGNPAEAILKIMEN